MSEESTSRSSGESNRGHRRGGRRGGRNRNRNQNRPRNEAKSSPSKRTRSKKQSSSQVEKPGIIKRLFGWLLPSDEPVNMRTAPAKTLDPSGPRKKRDRGDRPERGERRERNSEPRERRSRKRDDSAPKEERRKVEDKPFRIEVVNERLYVGNLSYDASEGDVFDLFSKIGEVRSVEIVQDRRSNRSKGFAFVEMARMEVALQAAEKLNKTDFMGREIVVNGAKGERREVEPATQEAATAPADAENGV